MTNQFNRFLAVVKALNEHDVEYILIGGVAIIIHGMERLTRDIDLFIKSNPANITNLKKALNSLYHDKSIDEISIEELNNYPVIRYGTPDGFYIDMMTRIGEAVMYDDLEYKETKFQGITIRIATPESLYNMKKNSLREKDKMDSLFLKAIIIDK